LLTEGEVGFGIPTLLRMEARVVGVVRSNEVSFLLSDRARIARVSSFSTNLACHARIHNLVGLLVRRLQSLHEKVHLGSKHIDAVDMMDSLSPFQLWLEAIFSTSAFAAATLSERKEPPDAASMWF